MIGIIMIGIIIIVIGIGIGIVDSIGRWLLLGRKRQQSRCCGCSGCCSCCRVFCFSILILSSSNSSSHGRRCRDPENFVIIANAVVAFGPGFAICYLELLLRTSFSSSCCCCCCWPSGQVEHTVCIYRLRRPCYHREDPQRRPSCFLIKVSTTLTLTLTLTLPTVVL
jgi:hypothetical protein